MERTMVDLSGIPNLSSQQLELLRAIGFSKKEALMGAKSSAVLEEMTHANEMLELSADLPSLETVESWIEFCKRGDGEEKSSPHLPVTTEREAQVSRVVEKAQNPEGNEISSLLSDAPFAIPLPSNALKEAQVQVTKVAEGLMLEDCDEQIDVIVSSRKNVEVIPEEEKQTKLINQFARSEPFQAEEQVKTGVDRTRVRTMEKFMEEGGNVEPLVANKPNVSKMTLAETNKGVSRESRRYIRGVLHNQRVKAYTGAVAFILFWLSFWLPFIGLAMFFFDNEGTAWGKYTPAIWILSFVLYVGFARKTNCPVCRQRQFSPKACAKHSKAHQVAGLGFMLPTAVHIVLFRWARCIFCGTSLRYKE